MPYKQVVIPMLDALTPLAERIGAVNTIVNDEKGQLVGYNTDCLGAVRALEEVKTIENARVLLLGAGGAARAIAHGLKDRGAELSIANRAHEKAEELAREVGARAVTLSEATRAREYHVVINATSKGMREVDTASPVPESAIAPDMVVMDIVYKPIETELLRAATRRGARIIHGGRMLLYQAAEQFTLYTGRSAPIEAMEQALALEMRRMG
jgi:shikimate dehydrogenase